MQRQEPASGPAILKSAAHGFSPGHRIVAVDVLRGLAIFIMVPANMAASIYAEPHAFWFRVVSSFAAPLFIAIAGMMIGLGWTAGKHGLPHYLVRGAMLLVTAAGVDALIWRVVPFYSYDVLYLIGIACPLTFLLAGIGRGWTVFAVAFILVLTPVLQSRLGYTDVPGETYLWGNGAGTLEVVSSHPTSAINHLLVDGYFPLFPWLGVSLAGLLAADAFFVSPAGARRLVLATAGLLAVGIIAWILYPGAQHVRDDYSELFYPPTIGFLLTALGVLAALLLAIRATPDWPIYLPLRWLGECALLMYILHLAIIAFVLEPDFPNLDLAHFLAVDLATVLVLLAIAGGVHWLKGVWRRRPYVLRFLLGG